MAKQKEDMNQNEKDQGQQMCCDDSGRTAQEHRAEAPDGKCCVDS